LTGRLLPLVLPPLAAVGVAVLWPYSAYSFSPALVPALVLGAAVVALVLTRPEYGIALALALTPLTNLQLGAHKPVQIVLPALAFALLAYGLLQTGLVYAAHSRAEPLAWGWTSIATILFVVAAVVSGMQAASPSASLKKIVILLAGAELFFAVLEIARDRRKLIVVAAGGLAGLFMAGAHGVAQHYLGFSGVAGFVVNGVLVDRVQGAFGHPNQYGGYLAFLLPLGGAILVSRAFTTAMRSFALLAVAVGLTGLVYSYARGAILGLVLGSIVWLAVLRPRTALVCTAIVAALAVAFAPATLKERFNPQAAGSDVPLRADIWRAAIDIYGTSPVVGVGVNNFGTAYKSLPTMLPDATQRRLLDQDAFRIPPHAQNLYLNVLAEEGAVGAGALALLLVAALVAFYRSSRIADPALRAIGLGCGAGFVAMLFHGMLELTLFTEMTLPFFALLAVATRAAAMAKTEPASA
jgi:O-antigen ligase